MTEKLVKHKWKRYTKKVPNTIFIYSKTNKELLGWEQDLENCSITKMKKCKECGLEVEDE